MGSKLLLIDTSAYYSFIDKNDYNHSNVSTALHKSKEEFVTTNYIIDELITLFKVRKLKFSTYKKFIDSLWNEDICSILRITEDTDLEAWKLSKKYKEHNFSFTDCTSFIIMKQYKILKACTLDKHFNIMGYKVINKISYP